MSDLWVTVPAVDIRLKTPTSMSERDVKFILRDVETIKSVIAQLESIKKTLRDSEEYSAQLVSVFKP